MRPAVPCAAVFSPSFVKNMTLIAPIDTGAWEGECNRTNNQQQSAPEDAKVCAVLKNQSACNADDPAHAVCDWRLTTKPKPVIRTIVS